VFKKHLLTTAIGINLVVWNYFLFRGRGFFSSEYMLGVAIVVSALVVLSLWALARRIPRLKKPRHLLLLSLLTAFLTPAVIIYLFWAIAALLAWKFEGLSAVLLPAFWGAIMSVNYWLPLGLLNFYLLRAYSKDAGQPDI